MKRMLPDAFNDAPVMQGVAVVSDTSNTEFFAGGTLLREWANCTEGEISVSKGKRSGSAALLAALREVCLAFTFT